MDLFAGCGGLSLGVLEAASSTGRRAEVALACEIDPVVRAVYAANFAGASMHPAGDVAAVFDGSLGTRLTRAERTVEQATGDVDILIAGPPCQGHSNLNNHTRREDERNALYLRVVRAAEVLEPDVVAIENVPSVVRDKLRVVETASNHLIRLGYRVDTGVVSIAELGVPQLRFRHILLASRAIAPNIDEMMNAHRRSTRTLAWAIADLRIGNGLYDTPSTLSTENTRRAKWLLARGLYDLPNEHRPACHRDKPDHRYKSMYGRLRWDQPAQTITTGFGSPGQGRYLHPSEPRTLTPHEAARVQFFPDWFDFSAVATRTALAHCVGNAVPPKLGFAVTRHLLGAGLG